MAVSQVVVIGPDPSADTAGGVVKHMRVLRSLECLSGAVFLTSEVDERSVCNRLQSACRISTEVWQLSASETEEVLVNASLQPGSLAKLYPLLLVLAHKVRVKDIHVFFHGGRLEDVPSTLRLAVKKCATLPGLLKRVRYYCLAGVQASELRRLLPDASTSLFSNYSMRESAERQERAVRRTITVLFVGRLVPEKGIWKTIKAVERLREKEKSHRSIRLVIAGDGPLAMRVRRYADKRQINWIDICGYVLPEALPDLYRAATVFALPSTYPEGMPYAVIEAMSYGLPVVTSERGALKEIVADGVNGFTVRADDPEAIASAIGWIHADRDRYNKMSQRVCDFFDRRFALRNAEMFYGSLIGNSTGEARRSIV